MPYYWIDVAFYAGDQVMSVERLPWRPAPNDETGVEGDPTTPPPVGGWVRGNMYCMKKSQYVTLSTCSDQGRVVKLIPTREIPDGRARGIKGSKVVAVYQECCPATVQRYKAEVQLINSDMNELLRDAMAGRFESSPRFSGFLRDVPDSVRQMLTASLENITAWLRSSTENRLSNWRTICRPLILVVPNEAARLDKRLLLDRFLLPLVHFFNLPSDRILVHGIGAVAEQDCPEWELFPPDVSVTTRGRIDGKRVFRWVSGKTISRRGVVDASPEYDGIFTNGLPAIMGGGAGREEQCNASSSRAQDALRRAAEFSSEERRFLFEQLQREFGGEPERRRERSAPPVAAAAGSAASLLIPPPLVVVDGVVVPPPQGINPLVFPPPMNIASG